MYTKSVHSQKSFLYRAVNVYNKLPRNLTLIKQENLFKKWCKKFNLDNNIKLKNQEDNVLEEENEEEDENNRMLFQCEN